MYTLFSRRTSRHAIPYRMKNFVAGPGDVVVGNHDCLGRPGGTRGVDESRAVAWLEIGPAYVNL